MRKSFAIAAAVAVLAVALNMAPTSAEAFDLEEVDRGFTGMTSGSGR